MMMPRCKSMTIGAVMLACWSTVCAQNPKPGKNEVPIRGHQQEIYFYPAQVAGQYHRKILFAPGDGGWRGFAITITEELAKAGYDVYCIDTRRYLQSFTGPVVLSTTDIASDFKQLARWIGVGGTERILLVGWSEGAGLGLVATAVAENQTTFEGLAANVFIISKLKPTAFACKEHLALPDLAVREPLARWALFTSEQCSPAADTHCISAPTTGWTAERHLFDSRIIVNPLVENGSDGDFRFRAGAILWNDSRGSIFLKIVYAQNGLVENVVS